MKTGEFQWFLFLVTMFFGIGYLLLAILILLFVKSNEIGVWSRFGGGKQGRNAQVAFNRRAFFSWMGGNEGKELREKYPALGLTWQIFRFCHWASYLMFALNISVFTWDVFKQGMIGGWKFR